MAQEVKREDAARDAFHRGDIEQSRLVHEQCRSETGHGVMPTRTRQASVAAASAVSVVTVSVVAVGTGMDAEPVRVIAAASALVFLLGCAERPLGCQWTPLTSSGRACRASRRPPSPCQHRAGRCGGGGVLRVGYLSGTRETKRGMVRAVPTAPPSWGRPPADHTPHTLPPPRPVPTQGAGELSGRGET